LLRRIQSFLQRPAAERRLCLRTWCFLLAVRAALACSSYPRVRAWFERRNARERPAASARPSRSLLAWSVRTAGRYVPSSRPCLTQALVLDSYLRRWEYPSRIAIGVARGSRGELEAHAWVESDGVVVLGGEERARFAELRSDDQLSAQEPGA
jgi:hypothetical protein